MSTPNNLKSSQPSIISYKNYKNHEESSIEKLDAKEDPDVILRNLKSKHCDRPVIAQININSLNPKFDPLCHIVKDNIDILIISETKLDASYNESMVPASIHVTKESNFLTDNKLCFK